MEHLKRLWRDIQRGENIDLYVTVIAAIVLAIFTIAGVASQSWIAPLTLVILALLAYSMLGNRHQIDKAYQQLTQTAEGVLRQKWPGDDLYEDLKNARELLIIGVSLERTIKSNYALLEGKLKRGASIKALVVDPNSPASEIAANRVYANVHVERTRNGIRATLESLFRLKQTTSGKLEIRIVDYPSSVGGFVIDPETARGVLYLKCYTFKMPDEDIPRLVLRPKDGYWYRFFTQQAEMLWENGKPYEAT